MVFDRILDEGEKETEEGCRRVEKGLKAANCPGQTGQNLLRTAKLKVVLRLWSKRGV